MTTESAVKRTRLALILSQFDRKKFPASVERLVHLFDRIPAVDFSLVVVDNAQPGGWCHELTDRIIHIGGDNRHREFTAFEQGRRLVAERIPGVEVFGFATDALMAYGDEYLDLIDEDTIHFCTTEKACVGWIDSFGSVMRAFDLEYEAWVRTSLFFIASHALQNIGTLDTNFDEDALFSRDPEKPFLETSPLSRDLREQIVAWLTTSQTNIKRENGWHSRFELRPETFDFFKAKTCAILREQMLSARLKSKQIPCFDFRLISLLASLRRDHLEPGQRQGWQWTNWTAAETELEPRLSIDRYMAPEVMRHGDEQALTIAGWALGNPKVESVSISVSGQFAWSVRCDLTRPDVIAVYSKQLEPRCGFETQYDLSLLPPGLHEVTCSIPSSGLSQSCGVIQVVARCDFSADRVLVPEGVRKNQRPTIAISGDLLASTEVTDIDITWAARPADLTTTITEDLREPSGLHRYRVEIIGTVPPISSEGHYRIGLEFRNHDELVGSWNDGWFITPSASREHSIAVRDLGPFCPETGTTSITLAGMVRNESAAEIVVLTRDKREVLELPLKTFDGSPWAEFKIDGEVSGIPSGPGHFELLIRKPPDHDAEPFANWRAQIELARPRVHVHRVSVDPLNTRTGSILSVEGWVENDRSVEALQLDVDGCRHATVELDQLREDVAEHMQLAAVLRHGFHSQSLLETEAGSHEISLCRYSDEKKDTLWAGTIQCPPRQLGFRVNSPEIAELARPGRTNHWSSICFQGNIVTDLVEVTIVLYVDGRAVERARVDHDGTFAVRHVPEREGEHTARVIFESSGRTLYDTGEVAVYFHPLVLPDEYTSSLSDLLHHFDIPARLGIDSEPLSIARAMLERNRGHLAGHRAIVSRLWQTMDQRSNLKDGGARRRSAGSSDSRPLKILFASWGVPCTRHGGGVWMTNLLKHLSSRHEITVIYCFSAHEEEWIEDVRPYAAGLIGVSRRTVPPAALGVNGAIGSILDEYVPELKSALDAELFDGDYDLVDYQYYRMLPHVVESPVPRVLTVFEEPFSALLNTSSDRFASHQARVGVIDRLIDHLYTSSVLLPEAFDDLIAVTEEDAQILRDGSGGPRVHINPIGVDSESLKNPAGDRDRSTDSPQTLIYLANYNHPPNVDAVRFFANRVFPAVLGEFPDVQFQIVGAHPGPEVRALAEQPGISVTGFVDDYRHNLWQAYAFVAPIFSGSGMRVKLLEAMACGLPVISTHLGMRGLGAENGVHFLRAEDAAQFIQSCTHLLSSPGEATAIGRRGRSLVVEKHSAEARANEREAIWQEIAATGSGSRHNTRRSP